MTELVTTQHTTIIITTHYIEEARQANMVSHQAPTMQHNTRTYIHIM